MYVYVYVCVCVCVQNGTLTEDIEGAVKEMRAGRIDYRVGRDRHLHMAVGRVSDTHRHTCMHAYARTHACMHACG